MTSLFRIHRSIDRLSGLPPLRQWLEKRYDKEFASNRKANLFRGVFESYDAAQATAPATRPVGYDNTDAASMYMNRVRKVFASDYPVMFWLEKLLANGERRILDLGGHIGVSYYAYRKYIDYPLDLRWAVHDVPAVMDRGRELAVEFDKPGQLSFCERFEDGKDAQMLFASGSLQYLPDTLPSRLSGTDSGPEHLLLNLVPVHAQQSYFTLQSIGTAFCPYRIFGMESFVHDFEVAGYQLVDRWENPEKSCVIPFFPKHSLDRYYGFYFKKK